MNMFKTTSAKSPQEYIDLLEEPRKEQIKRLHELIIKTVPKLKPFIISGMIGYGSLYYKSPSGREGDWSTIVLASQKNYISVYVCSIRDGKYVPENYKKELPKASIGRSCIRFKKIEDIDLEVLKTILKEAENSPAFSASSQKT